MLTWPVHRFPGSIRCCLLSVLHSQVIVRRGGRGKGGTPEGCMLSLTGDCLVASARRRGEPPGPTTETKISSIRGVQIEQEAGKGSNVCLVTVSGFERYIFACCVRLIARNL